MKQKRIIIEVDVPLCSVHSSELVTSIEGYLESRGIPFKVEARAEDLKREYNFDALADRIREAYKGADRICDAYKEQPHE